MISLEIKYTKSFKKDLKKVSKQGKIIDKLWFIVTMLSENKSLAIFNYDHALNDTKIYNGCRECHIESDWLLIYKYNYEEDVLYLVATGSHSDLFR